MVFVRQNVHSFTQWSLTTLLLLVGAGCGGPRTIPTIPSEVVGHCIYVNGFSRREECKEYRGTGWTTEQATNDCRGRNSSFQAGACNYPSIIGHCILNADRPDVHRITFPGTDPNLCGSSRTGCEFFGGGVFVPDGVCQNMTGPVNAAAGLPVFQPPTLVCREPNAGEPRGMGTNGQVCTRSAISACTEPGRRFADYASCEQVRTQRPYRAVPADERKGRNDPRMSDPAYVAELNWVRSQVESCGCVCCHSERLAPNGPSNWYIEAPGNWMDTFHNAGLALGAGYIDSAALGAYPAEQNHGFARTTSGIPSTDPARMARFFQQELAYRGVSRGSFDGARPFGGPIYDQTIYQPTECTGQDGVSGDNTIRWSGGVARYVYVLEAGSRNPGVPPDQDLPQGTVWRIDVPHTGMPIESGIRYGQVPTGTTQRFPEGSAPAALTNGRRYYLYVLADIGIPITRCTFQYPR